MFFCYIYCTQSDNYVINFYLSLYFFVYSLSYIFYYFFYYTFYYFITLGAFPGTFKTKPFKFIFVLLVFELPTFCLPSKAYIFFSASYIFLLCGFYSISCLEGIFSFCLLLSMKVFEFCKFYFLDYLLYYSTFFQGSSTFFSIFSF